jgi:hypothetical protein
MIASFESVGAGGDSPSSDIVGARSWLGRVRPWRRWRSSEPGLCFRDRPDESALLIFAEGGDTRGQEQLYWP